MKISQMINREDFYNILFNSVNRYYPKLDYSNAGEYTGNYHVYKHLNAIIPRNPSALIKEFLKDEFTYTNPIKNIGAHLYIDMAVNWPRLFADSELYWGKNGNTSKMIFPSNRKIRIMDFAEMESFVCMKEGFPDTMMRKEIDFRIRNSERSFILPINSHGDGFYTERIMKGRSIARIRNAGEKKNAYRKALEIMKTFASQSAETVSADEYAMKKYNEILNIVKDSDSYIISMCNEILNKISNIDVITMISHGDFQPGNIWIENSDIRIIDWETYERRISIYDELVFNSGIRNSDNYTETIGKIQTYINNMFDNRDYANNMLRLFIIEDIKWMIQENESLPENSISNALNNVRSSDLYKFMRESI